MLGGINPHAIKEVNIIAHMFSDLEPIQQAQKVKSLIVALLDENKAEDIVTLDLDGKTSIADFMVIASGTSTRHVHMLAEKVSEFLKEAELYYIPPEGVENCEWVIVDAGDVVVHIFRPEFRELYNLEKMWSVSVKNSHVEVIG